jgi:hypothetical protein
MSKSIITLFFVIALIAKSSSQSNIFRKTEWTVEETKQWVAKQKTQPTWYGTLLYQGSDTIHHHFISRVMDEWVFFKIKKTELTLSEEKLYSSTSSAPLGYYYVDATNNFIKTKEFESIAK